MNLHILILAAGNGKRMRSTLPKVLHPLAGQPILAHVIKTAQQLNPKQIHVVYGSGGNTVADYFPQFDLHWVKQPEQLGTADAVAQALPFIADEDRVLILYGDVPLIRVATLQNLLQQAPDNGIGLLVADFADPHGLGRIIRNDQQEIVAIVEQRDANPHQAAISEINTGILTCSAGLLKKWLPSVDNNNQQSEFYLTDIIAIAVQENRPVQGVMVTPNWHSQGINDRTQLAQLERLYQNERAQELLANGVSFIDPNRFDLRGELLTGQDIIIDVNVVLEGKVSLGNNVKIEPNCIIRNSVIGDNSLIKANSVIEDSVIENDCQVGPFARLRPGTHLKSQAHVGNFVEVKNSLLGVGVKAGHLSYIGDATLGEHVNVGAGTITCNYDGKNKHQTIIGDRCFIGSNTSLVAPLTVGEDAIIGAGSTITKDAPAGELTVGRSLQKTVHGWKKKRQNNDHL